MVSDELDALPGTLSLVAEELTAPVAGMHEVISRRVFRYIGPPGNVVRRVHDTIAGGVYGSIPGGARLIGEATRTVARHRAAGREPISGNAIASRWQAVVNALWGNKLADGNNDARAIRASFRRNGLRVEATQLAGEVHGRPSHVVILLHGLGQTESCWEGPGRLLADLEGEPGVTPLVVRYNTGQSVSRAGAEVGSLILDLWDGAGRAPSFSLVGFSLGGLVARAAYSAAVLSGMPADESFRHIVTVGSPHAGSHLARLGGFTARALSIPRTTRSLAAFIDGRSDGLRELGWTRGLVDLPSPASVQHHFVAATVTGDHRHPLGALMGDLVVRVRSATAPAAVADNVSIYGSIRHMDLLSDPGVRSQILAWLRLGGERD